MMEVTPQDLFAKIGELTVENGKLREQIGQMAARLDELERPETDEPPPAPPEDHA